MISYNYGQKTFIATEILCVSWKVGPEGDRIKTFMVRREDGKLGSPTKITKDGKKIYAENYEIGEWSEVGDK